VTALVGQKFIGLEPDSPTRKAIDRIFRENKIRVEHVINFDNVETVKRAVEIDVGISIVPLVAVLQEVKQGSLVAVHFRGRKFPRPLAILHRKGRVLMPAMRKFIETLRTDLSLGPKI